jgi:hypothetical protein
MRRHKPFRFQALAKEIAAELRAKFNLITRPAHMKTADALGLERTSTLLSAVELSNRNTARKKTGSPTAAMGQKANSAFRGYPLSPKAG